MQARQICILGSTGSIGTQTLDVIRQNPECFKVHTLTAGGNYKLLIEQALEFRPKVVVIAREEHAQAVRDALVGHSVEVLSGSRAIETAVVDSAIDVVITAMVGYAGLRPTIAAIRARKTIGLANKETLVVAGALIMPLAEEHGAQIIPVDSEHSAIYQCLVGEARASVEKIILTASGGPFRTFSHEALRHVTPAEALQHPNWTMGAKVTIDSATLMNKGFEMIEACWLFACEPSDVEVLVHPESIVHSMVQFKDGSVKAQLGMPDMRLPISYALGITHRVSNAYPRYDFLKAPLTFERPDIDRFPNLALAYEAARQGGVAPAALNAANEVAVQAFLEGRLSFVHIPKLIQAVVQAEGASTAPLTLELIAEVDAAARRAAEALVHELG